MGSLSGPGLNLFSYSLRMQLGQHGKHSLPSPAAGGSVRELPAAGPHTSLTAGWDKEAGR